jgi:hypothetical protein
VTTFEAVARVIDVLESQQVPYMIVGSLASSQYGISRDTKDADIVVELGGQSITAVTGALGDAFRLDPQIMFETVTGTTRHVVNVPSVHFAIEFFRLSDDPYDRERFARRRRIHFPQLSRDAFVSTPEDVVVTKLQWAARASRGKDRDDLRDVLAVWGTDRFDWDYIHRWSDEHGTRDVLEEILKTLPPGG